MCESIPEKMQAVICHGPNDYRLEEVAVPQRGPGEALADELAGPEDVGTLVEDDRDDRDAELGE